MRWEDKLRLLITAQKSKQVPTSESPVFFWKNDSGLPDKKTPPFTLLDLLNITFEAREPLSLNKINELKEILPFELPLELQNLYLISDGIYISNMFRIFNLQEYRDRNGRIISLLTVNNSRLEQFQKVEPIKLIFGVNAASGEYLCLRDDGVVILMEPVELSIFQALANSLDDFFSDICLGEGYIRVFQPSFNDFWVPVLKLFKFIA